MVGNIRVQAAINKYIDNKYSAPVPEVKIKLHKHQQAIESVTFDMYMQQPNESNKGKTKSELFKQNSFFGKRLK